jgi:8-oxo-dGTP pyrophosphatase MutT (NUDIX family)
LRHFLLGRTGGRELDLAMTGRSTETADSLFDVAELRRRGRSRLAQNPPQIAVSQPSVRGDFATAGFELPKQTLEAARPAAVLVPIVARDTPTVLLTERAHGLRKHSGQIAFPGGKIDRPGESPLDAALRETREEIGLDPARIELLGYLDFYYTGSGYRIAPVVSLVLPPFDLLLNPDEVTSAFEVPLEFLMLPGNHDRVVRERDGRQFYAMPFEDRYIWGATAGMIRLLYEKLYA